MELRGLEPLTSSLRSRYFAFQASSIFTGRNYFTMKEFGRGESNLFHKAVVADVTDFKIVSGAAGSLLEQFALNGVIEVNVSSRISIVSSD
jgi:hypothetical protein